MIARLLGIRDLAPKGRFLLMKYAILFALMTIMINASTTYYILHVLSFVSLTQLGFLIALSMGVQFLFDYPTGALADWVGHKWVLFIAYMTFAFSFGILAISRSFEEFILVFLLKGFASAQHSEALSSWLHLNYRAIADEVDPTRYHYKLFVTRYKIIGSASTSFAYIFAGFISYVYSRSILFAVQAIMFMMLAVICVLTVNNLSEAKDSLKSGKKLTYLHHLIGGAKIAATDGKIGFLLISNVIWLTALTGWSNFFLHPLYFSYTGSDVGAGLMRSLIWWIEVVIIFFFAALIAKRRYHWLPRMRMLQSLVFFGGFAVLFSYYPPTLDDASLNLAAVMLALGLMTLNLFFTRVYNTIFSVIYLDNVPDAYRNSVYSLIPTLTLIGSIPMLLFFGIIIELLGQSLTLAFLMVLGIVSSILSYLGVVSIDRHAVRRRETEVGLEEKNVGVRKEQVAASSAP